MPLPTRTAKGKTWGAATNALTISSIALDTNEMLVVGLAHVGGGDVGEGNAEPTSIRIDAGPELALAEYSNLPNSLATLYYLPPVAAAATVDLSVHWAENILSGAMWATGIKGVHLATPLYRHGSWSGAGTTALSGILAGGCDCAMFANLVTEESETNDAGTWVDWQGTGISTGQREGVEGTTMNLTVAEGFSLSTGVLTPNFAVGVGGLTDSVNWGLCMGSFSDRGLATGQWGAPDVAPDSAVYNVQGDATAPVTFLDSGDALVAGLTYEIVQETIRSKDFTAGVGGMGRAG